MQAQERRGTPRQGRHYDRTAPEPIPDVARKKKDQGTGDGAAPDRDFEHIHGIADSVPTGERLIANAEVAHLSCGLIRLGEIACRAGRVMHLDSGIEAFVNDPEAEKLLAKKYLEPWSIPDPV